MFYVLSPLPSDHLMKYSNPERMIILSGVVNVFQLQWFMFERLMLYMIGSRSGHGLLDDIRDSQHAQVCDPQTATPSNIYIWQEWEDPTCCDARALLYTWDQMIRFVFRKEGRMHVDGCFSREVPFKKFLFTNLETNLSCFFPRSFWNGRSSPALVSFVSEWERV